MINSFKRLAATTASLLTLASCGLAPSRLAVVEGAGVPAAAAAPGAWGLSLIVLPDMGVTGVLDALKGAKRSIKLEMYMLTTSKAAGEIIAALIERKKAGVNVQVMLETQPYMPAQPPKCQTGTFNPNTGAIKLLTEGGVSVKYTSPRFKYTHAKSMVIDNEVAFIMSANMTNSAYTVNRDYIVVDRNRADVADVAKIFDADWVGAHYVPQNPRLVVSPINSRDRLLALIDSAQKTLVIQTEFFSDPQVADHLRARVKAGVDVTVMMSYQTKDRCTGSSINDDEAKQLAEAGVTKVAFVRAVTLHAKTIIADGKRAYVGSENLSANSLDNNREIGILMDDPGIVANLIKITQHDWNSRTATKQGLPAADDGGIEPPGV
jgi:phosphatidylserine/phosphatidylglycerophosphate/cardiolipin synthase-like enzyme